MTCQRASHRPLASKWHKVPAILLCAATVAIVGIGCGTSNFSGGAAKQPAKKAISKSQTFTQISPESQEEIFTLTPNLADRVQTLQQGARKLDILVVIDDSSSMAEEQEKLGSKMAALLDSVAHTDWQIAVVTTFAGTNDCFRDLILKSDTDAEERFRVAVGEAGAFVEHGDEQGLKNSLRGLRQECKGQKEAATERLGRDHWLRSGSAIAVLIVSDEDNCSFPGSKYCDEQERQKQKDDTLAYAKQIRTPGVDIRYYAIIQDTETPECEDQTNNQFAYPGRDYKEVVKDQFGGVTGSICDRDYSKTLQKISADMASLAISSITLDEEPASSEFTVNINGAAYQDYRYEDGDIKFLQPIPEIVEIAIGYKVLDHTTTTAEFVLAQQANPESFRITWNSESTTNWQYDPNSNQLQFERMGDQAGELAVSYDIASQLQQTFTLEKAPTGAGGISLTIDDEPFVTTIAVADDGKTIRLTPPPPMGSTFVIHYNTLDY